MGTVSARNTCVHISTVFLLDLLASMRKCGKRGSIMLKTNEYFEGKVKSIALKNSQGESTIGVMDIGEYEFGTSTVEYMTVISGVLIVSLPNATQEQKFGAGESFTVAAQQKFSVKLEEQTAYICLYK